jgi:hypothetical protein
MIGFFENPNPATPCLLTAYGTASSHENESRAICQSPGETIPQENRDPE